MLSAFYLYSRRASSFRRKPPPSGRICLLAFRLPALRGLPLYISWSLSCFAKVLRRPPPRATGRFALQQRNSLYHPLDQLAMHKGGFAAFAFHLIICFFLLTLLACKHDFQHMQRQISADPVVLSAFYDVLCHIGRPLCLQAYRKRAFPAFSAACRKILVSLTYTDRLRPHPLALLTPFAYREPRACRTFSARRQESVLSLLRAMLQRSPIIK